MKRILFFLSFLVTISCSAQVTTRVLNGFNPVNGLPGYKIADTLKTIYYQAPLYADGDTVKTTGGSGGGQWTKIGNNIRNSNTGKVGVNTDTAHAQFEVASPTNTTQIIDSTGIMLSTPFAATLGANKNPGPLVFKSSIWTGSTGGSASYQYMRLGVTGNAFYLQNSADGVTYGNIFHTSGAYTIFDGGVQGSSANFSSTITAAGFSSAGNNMYNINGGGGQTTVGKTPVSWPSEPSAIAAIYSNGKQGLLLPTLTMSQRDSIGYTVSAVTITNGGSGYTSAPNVTNTQTYLNSSAPVTNGLLAWGGNYFMGTATISGGAVTGVTITQGGYFNGAVKINFVGGGGSGATATATMSRLLPAGLTIYCSDCTATDSSTGVQQTWNGSVWKSCW